MTFCPDSMGLHQVSSIFNFRFRARRWAGALLAKRTSARPGQQLTIEARGRQFGVAHGVLDVSMAEIHLQGARVGALVGKLKAAGVSEHVWVGLVAKLGHDAQPRHHLAPPRRRETQHRGRCRHPALAFFALSAVPRVFYGTA